MNLHHLVTKLLPVLGLLASLSANSETATNQNSTVLAGQGSTVATVPSTTSAGKIIGALEFRPSFGTKVGEAHTENTVTIGYQFNPNTSVYYRQEFNTNIDDPTGKNPGLGLYAFDGSLRAKLANVWKPNDDLSLTYEARLYAPTEALKREAGLITAVRNYARFKYRMSSVVALTLDEVPILHAYSQAGVVRSTGAKEANPIFENRVYFGPEITPLKGLKLYFPVILNNVRYGNFLTGAKNNDVWAHKLWIYPELTYVVNPNVTVGLAYYSDNLMKADWTELTLGSGLEKGVTQLIFATQI